ncbi:MAG: putative metal-binding motif-containing protein [Myxococcota bacterium]|nr:putative metal-binding motif-containing protein [Myxococcota bacterium]MDW8360863.1 putative metal-binding motif-containing protein [Myxococcales bacterium]
MVLVLAACASDGGAPGGRRDAGGGDGDVFDATHDGSESDGARDAGGDAPTGDVGLCEACTAHEQCGPTARCVSLTGGTRVCAAVCNPDIPSCPRGFDCVLNFSAADVTTCVPIGERCCIDQDADGHGRGVGCLGPDCDDTDIERHPAARERCNMLDDDCDGMTDESATDCRGQACDRVAENAFEEYPPGSCTEGRCAAPEPVPCGLYTCDDRGESGNACATGCAPDGTDDDGFCVGSAHCDGGSCVADLPDGEPCDEASDCISGHCNNGFCCSAGTCCRTAADCPSTGGIGTFCTDPRTCQGSRGEVVCESNRCGTRTGVPDDRACDASVEADDCGAFRSVFCTGAMDQPPPRCPTSCRTDADCDAEAHCDAVCVPDLADGETCDEDSDCASGHCSGNVCCARGDCCRRPEDCPARYGRPPSCDSPSTCQGTRDAASCEGFVCGTVRNVPDDSACHAGLEALGCGLYPSRFCTGGTDQTPPICASSCTSDAECDPVAHCETTGPFGGTCELDRADGETCDEDSDCRSGHCANGHCCASGDCCNDASDCPRSSYGAPPLCVDPSRCQGQRRDPVCNARFQCELGPPVDDDSGCAGRLANDCGLYPSVFCTAAIDQPPPTCPSSCRTSADCDMGAFCMGGRCMPRGMVGDACTSSGQCQDGLQCVDGVCCTSACTGACMACNVSGSRGTCTPIPSGQDPDGECGGFSCAAYYAGFTGDTCYRRADVSDAAVACDGRGACQGPELLCPMQPAGGAVLTCDALCQDPTAGTCVGTTPGSCTNVTPSPDTHSCGVGACRRTVPRCSMGAPVECMPGSPTPESCNDVDDDCNGAVDDGLSGDTYETNNTCPASYYLGKLWSRAEAGRPTSTSVTATIYGSGDVDVWRLDFEENDSSCGCPFPSTDEDYAVVGTLTVPAGAGSYELCGMHSSCATGGSGTCVTVPAGTTSSPLRIWKDDSCCVIGDCTARGTWWFVVRGIGSPGFECLPYTLRISTEIGCM